MPRMVMQERKESVRNGQGSMVMNCMLVAAPMVMGLMRTESVQFLGLLLQIHRWVRRLVRSVLELIILAISDRITQARCGAPPPGGRGRQP